MRLIFFLPFLLFVILVSFWTENNLDFYVSLINHSTTHVGYFWSFVLTFVLNGVILVLDIVGSILRIFIH